MADTRTPDASPSGHPVFRRLLDVADGVTTDRRVRIAKEHVEAGCATCAAELASITALRDALVAGPLPPPPRRVLRRATRLLTTRRVQAGVAVVRRALMTLVLDGRAELAPTLRSVGGERRMLWTIGELELFATLSRGSGGVHLRAQFLPSDAEAEAPSGRVRVVCDGRVTADVALDAEGEFAASELRPGTYVIEGEVGGVALASPPFVIAG